MKKINNSQLANIGSMAELKKAQSKVDRAIHHTELKLQSNYYAAKDMYSYKDYIAYGLSAVDTVQSLLRYVKQGYYAATDILRMRRR